MSKQTEFDLITGELVESELSQQEIATMQETEAKRLIEVKEAQKQAELPKTEDFIKAWVANDQEALEQFRQQYITAEEKYSNSQTWERKKIA